MANEIKIEIKISYFGIDCGSVEYTFEAYANDLAEADQMAKTIVAEEELAAYNDGAMMDTFYFEYDYIMDESIANANGLSDYSYE